ncbi:MAG: hypothetical protein HY884_05090 [Deltaproteobacteria bacterium]|nr:hypothetical protein [Deltaproteobacteria bacterium]
MNAEYTKKLENLIKQMLTPLKGVPLNLVIEGISNHKIIPFNKRDSKDAAVLENLKGAAYAAGKTINKKGIVRARPNEIGNDIEPYVKDALNKLGYAADVPFTASGRKKAAGYPDIEFTDEFGRANYLECKTFLRSFYLSPDSKITKDARHFVMSFEIYAAGKKGRNNVYKSKGWKILSVENLDVDVKYEFNSDNLRLYSEGLMLAEGELR